MTGFDTNPPPSSDKAPTPKAPFPGYGQQSDLGVNWRIKFADADGIPLNMLSFDQIDFGAIAYKEIFQNVKTILATPLYSATLERLLGVDQTIVDLPIDQAAQATVAILDALYFWEPRVVVVNIGFESDVISGHLLCNLQLNIRNVIYGTDKPYDRNNFFASPDRIPAGVEPGPLPPPPEPTPPPPEIHMVELTIDHNLVG
jgi:Bacteriophage baseplate protein W